MKKIIYWRKNRAAESVECDEFTHDLHEITGNFTLKFYQNPSAEKRLVGAVGGVERFVVERLA